MLSRKGTSTLMKISLKKPNGVTAEYKKIKVGGKTIKILIVRPENASSERRVPGVLWIHGGGYMLGMPEMVYMSRAIDLVTKAGAVVLSPDYTLSLRAPYPTALRECHAALLYMAKHAGELGISPDQIVVGGESAGGGLAAALCMYAKDHQTVKIAFQMPLYPMLDCFDTDSSRDNHAKIWNTRRNHIGWKLYLRGLKGRKRIPAYASPARRKDYSGLPPCYTFVGDIEPFYRETLDYAANLRAAGVDAEVDVYKGFYHAYDMLEPDTAEAREAADRFVEKFRDACEKYRA